MVEGLEQLNNNFCFFTLGDITNKENKIVEIILSYFDINYIPVDDISLNQDELELVNDVIDFGIKNIIIDIKVGYKINEERAYHLSQEILNIAKEKNIKIMCFITNLNLSLGTSFGYALEQKEINNILSGKNITLLSKLSIKIASYILSINNKLSFEENQKLIINNINNNKYIIEENNTINSKMFSIKSSKSGFIKNINILEIKDLLNKLDSNDSSVGIVFSNQIGNYILENEELAKVYLNNKDIQASEVLDCFIIELEIGKMEDLVKEIVG